MEIFQLCRDLSKNITVTLGGACLWEALLLTCWPLHWLFWNKTSWRKVNTRGNAKKYLWGMFRSPCCCCQEDQPVGNHSSPPGGHRSISFISFIIQLIRGLDSALPWELGVEMRPYKVWRAQTWCACCRDPSGICLKLQNVFFSNCKMYLSQI